jgi:hypothetical protein
MAAIFDLLKQRERQVRVGRIEPKTFYANERTFLTWLNMATTVGSISTALVAFGMKDAKHAGGVSILATVLVLLAIIFCIYASEFYGLFVFRSFPSQCVVCMPEFADGWCETVVGNHPCSCMQCAHKFCASKYSSCRPK